jgi:hypothetical protein
MAPITSGYAADEAGVGHLSAQHDIRYPILLFLRQEHLIGTASENQ